MSSTASPSISDCSTASTFNLSDLEEALQAQKKEETTLLSAGDSTEVARLGPPSYYHVQEMNKDPPVFSPARLSRVPSQYQLESLTEVYVFDIPQLALAPTPLLRHHQEMAAANLDQLEEQPQLLPVYVTSEYVSFE